MFSEELKKISWDDTSRSILEKTEADVKHALSKSHLDIEDFKALVSPAAEPYLEVMASMSQRYTLERFGKTIGLYIPMYITNSCANACIYCGFNAGNKIKRTILTEEEIESECKAVKALGPYESLLIVTGENPAKAGVDYIARALDIAKKYFSQLQIEVMPLPMEDYASLKDHGLNGVICFQETYNRANYKTYHPKGQKSDFEWRVNGFDRMGQAGVHKIGMGILGGLEDWRTDVTMLATHLRYLQKHYWKTRYSVNFPRLRPSESGFQPNVVMTDKHLAQVTFAMRIFDHDVDISYSTRESSFLRDNMIPLGVTTMSAESKTEPGGYCNHGEALEQFHISDERTSLQVAEAIRKAGREPVWKDWDVSFDMMK